MARPLSSGDLARLEAATRTLLSPLVFPDADAWRGEVMRTACELFGTRGATFYLPDRPGVASTLGMDEPFSERLRDYTAATFAGAGASVDPVFNAFYAAMTRRRIGVWSMVSADHDLLGNDGKAWDTLFYHEVLRHVRAGDAHGLFLPQARGSVMITVHDFRRAPSDDEHFPLLRVLHPAFAVGVEALGRLDAHRAALDVVGEPLAVYDVDGRPLHRNAALARLLVAEPEPQRVEVALAEMIRRVRALAFPMWGETAGVVVPAVEVQTERARYTLRVSRLGPGLFGPDGALVVAVVADGGTAALPTVEEVRQQFGLSKREAEVALLVAQGLSNDQIADRLFVSKHTVRHHVESAMAKLDLTGRGREAVAPRLLGAEVA